MATIASDVLETQTDDGWTIRHWPHENMLSLYFEIIEPDDMPGDISFEGSIDVDGCINWRPDHDTYAHCCQPDDLDRLKRALEALTEQAAIRLPKWRGKE